MQHVPCALRSCAGVVTTVTTATENNSTCQSYWRIFIFHFARLYVILTKFIFLIIIIMFYFDNYGNMTAEPRNSDRCGTLNYPANLR